MPDFSSLSNSFRDALIVGVVIGYSCCEVIVQAKTLGWLFLLFILLSLTLMFTAYAMNIRHKRLTVDLLKYFGGIEDVSIERPTYKMFLQNARTPRDKLKGLEVSFYIFLYGGFGLGLGLQLLLYFYQNNLVEQKIDFFALAALLFVLLLLIKFLIFLWDIPYLKRIYEKRNVRSELV